MSVVTVLCAARAVYEEDLAAGFLELVELLVMVVAQLEPLTRLTGNLMQIQRKQPRPQTRCLRISLLSIHWEALNELTQRQRSDS